MSDVINPAVPPAEPPAEPVVTTDTPTGGGPIGEDWLATIVGLVLVALVLLGVIGKGMIP